MGHRLSKLNWTQSSSSRSLNQNSNPNKKAPTSSFVQIVSIVKTSDTFDQRLLAINQDFQIEGAVEEPLLTVSPTRMIITIKLTKMEPGNNNQMDNNNPTSLASKDHGNALCGNFDNNIDSNKQLVNFKIKKNLLRDAETTTTTLLLNDSVGTDSVNNMELNNLNRTIIDDNAKSTRNFTNNFTPNPGFIGLINNENVHGQSDNLVEMFTQSGDSTSWTAARVNECNNSNNMNNNTIIASYNNRKNNKNCNISTLPINMNCSTASISLCNNTDRISHNTKLLPEEHNVPICYNKITKPINDCNSGHALRSEEDHMNRNSLQEITSNKYPSMIHCVCTESMETSSSRHTDDPTSSSASKHSTNNRRDSKSSESQKKNNKNCGTWSVSTQGPSACFQQHLLHTVTRHGPNVIVLSVMEEISDRGATNGECNQVQVPIACIQDAHFNSNMFRDSTYSQDHCVQMQPQKLTVHSQADYFHCLVPDLEKITSSSFYWGKMDRYEAERLLEGKPEGTFLLRDSAQEEYLFSVTFRKYERSLHARIEQFNHKFSFDCHDPGVFTAPTVTGLLEHYKDPTCVMFFEPMLAIPLPRKFSFSLQQLCRATIVSNINYDGVNELQLPNSLKAYLKEYHYKFRVRVKPCDDLLYTCS